MWAVCKNEKLLTYPKIQTRTCIDTRKELVTRGTLEDWERFGGKPEKKGEWEINEESLRENQGETNKESLRLWERKTSGKKIKGKDRICEGTNEERFRNEG